MTPMGKVDKTDLMMIRWVTNIPSRSSKFVEVSWTHIQSRMGRHQMETISALIAICARNSPHKGQWRWALMFSLICVWINSWVNNGEAGDLRRYRANYDVSVMPHNLVHCNIWRWTLTTEFKVKCGIHSMNHLWIILFQYYWPGR